jgi:hypothetical protein
MAVITQTTFNPLNDFVRVRLGQGVPIVDADVNERDDIHMFELRAALRWFFGDGVPDASDAFRVVGTGVPNDVTIRAGVSAVPAGASPEERALRHVGRCLVDGLDVAIAADVAFKAQALHVSRGAPATALAAALGVPTIAEMPVLAGTVVVYLDVWERLVTPTETPALVLPGLGTESCARVKREWVVRVRAGTTAPVPGDADYQTGHGYYALATLARRTGDQNVNAADVTDRRQTGLTLLALIRRVQQLESLVRSSLPPPFFQLHQNWCAPMLAAWTTGAANGGTVTKVVNPSANKMGVWLRIRAPGGSNAHSSKFSETVCGGPWPSTMLAVLEFDIDASALVGKDVQAKFGLVHDESPNPSTEDFVMIYKSNASANWIFRTGSPGGTQTTTDTGVAPSGVQRMRIETYGSRWPGRARALLYINDALEATHTTNLPADDEMKLFAGFANDEVLVADVDVYVSPMTFLARRLVP